MAFKDTVKPYGIKLTHQEYLELCAGKTDKAGYESIADAFEVDLITNEFHILQYFKITISADDVTKGKPDPEPYQITAKKIGFKTKECVVIEDSKSGVSSAIQAGCFCIGVTTTHDRKTLSEADIVVDFFNEINHNLLSSLENFF